MVRKTAYKRHTAVFDTMITAYEVNSNNRQIRRI